MPVQGSVGDDTRTDLQSHDELDGVIRQFQVLFPPGKVRIFGCHDHLNQDTVTALLRNRRTVSGCAVRQQIGGNPLSNNSPAARTIWPISSSASCIPPERCAESTASGRTRIG